MKQVGIFGGTFNPVHNGHLVLAHSFLQSMSLDEVWLMVTPLNPFKRNDTLLDDAARLEMVKAAISGEDFIKASDYEFHLPVPSYTWTTLCRLRIDYPDCRFSLLIGSDNWAKFDLWYAHDEIIRNHDIAVYPREDWFVDASSLPPNVHLLNTPYVKISSTMIRQRIMNGETISDLVPKGVEQLIRVKGYYL